MPTARRLTYTASALIAAATVIYVFSRRRTPSYGSATNASDAVSAPFLAADATPEDVLDVGVQYTFPASDPVSIEHAYNAARAKENGRP